MSCVPGRESVASLILTSPKTGKEMFLCSDLEENKDGTTEFSVGNETERFLVSVRMIEQ